MDKRTADKAASLSRALLENQGWSGFILPWITARQETIKEDLTSPMPSEKTADLREEYRVLKSLATLPERNLSAALAVLSERGGDDD
jgi:hypothetical protein